jgi:hypothetical protein
MIGIKASKLEFRHFHVTYCKQKAYGFGFLWPYKT